MAWTESVNLSATHRGREESCKDIQKGLWTEDEDSMLLHYIKKHGEGHWDFVARCTGLKRTGKSCRLRWLNYLRPGIRHGNFTLQEQLKILQLYLLWGNRWSKIAESLHGRTDNEIKNFWRTRVQKQAKQLNCDVNSKEFRGIIRDVLMPRLAEQIRYSKSLGDDGSSSKVVIPQELSSSSSSSNLAMELCNDEAILMGDNPLVDQFQHVQNQVDIVDQVGDDIWNDENVNFLRQILSGDHNIGSEANLERESEEGKMFM